MSENATVRPADKAPAAVPSPAEGMDLQEYLKQAGEPRTYEEMIRLSNVMRLVNTYPEIEAKHLGGKVYEYLRDPANRVVINNRSVNFYVRNLLQETVEMTFRRIMNDVVNLSGDRYTVTAPTRTAVVRGRSSSSRSFGSDSGSSSNNNNNNNNNNNS